jgi:phosphoribosylamine--glycine ligase
VRVLVVGSGGREHALAARLAESPRLSELHAAPGNPGIEQVAQLHDVPVADVERMVELAVRLRTDLVVVGPEAPLVAGLADRLERRGLTVFGPGQRAAQVEGSKEFAKRVMDTAGVATAEHWACDTVAAAQAAVAELDGRVVIKADGLAGGKGVFVCDTATEAEQAIRACLVDQAFGASGTRILVEQRLSGPEVSVLALCDGERVLPLAPARDHKRVGDGDQGPNTGGMGCISPVPDFPDERAAVVAADVHRPVVNELARLDTPFAGCLYAGLMLTADGPSVLEFNARFGDPETQVVLPRMRGDLLTALERCATGSLVGDELEITDEACMSVVMAAPGYPGSPAYGGRISGVDRAEALPGVRVIHAGTARDDGGGLVVSGGRVLNVVASAPDLAEARRRAYAAVAEIGFDGAVWRSDIGKQIAVTEASSV